MSRELDIDREISQRGIPISAQNTYRRALGGNRPAAVKAMCLECQGYEDGARQAIRDCPSVGCPLHAVRPFQRKTSNEIDSDHDADNDNNSSIESKEPSDDTRELSNAIKASLEVEAKERAFQSLSRAKDKILNHLQMRGESARGYIIFSTGIPESLWTEAIRSLLAKGEIEKSGEKRSTRYRLKED